MNPVQGARMDAYIRVSRVQGREGPSYISPDVQRDAINRWAEYKGARIVAEHIDEDQSGGTHDRPGLNAAIRRALNGETDGIVCRDIDRFSRFTEGGLQDLRRLQEVGARLVFTTQDIDTSTPHGKMVYTILLATHEAALDQLKAGWRIAKARAIDRGAHIGPTPLGYRRGDDGRLVPDHRDETEGSGTALIVREAFAHAASGGLHAALAFLSKRDLRHREGKRAGKPYHWNTHTVRRLLASRTYLGEAHYGDGLINKEAHEPIVDRDTWHVAQHAADPEAIVRRASKAHFPLSGLATCASCGNHLVGYRAGTPLPGETEYRRMYRCSAAKGKGAARCKAPAMISAVPLEQHVQAIMDATPDHRSRDRKRVLAAVADASRAAADAERRLIDWAAMPGAEQDALGRDAYLAGMDQRRAERDAARAEHEQTLTRLHAVTPHTANPWSRVASITVQKGRGNLEERVSVEIA